MAVNSRSRREATEAPRPKVFDSDVSSYESSPGRFVFVEDGNTDGWLATDLTVEARR